MILPSSTTNHVEASPHSYKDSIMKSNKSMYRNLLFPFFIDLHLHYPNLPNPIKIQYSNLKNNTS